MVADRNPHKQAKLLPGTHIPVVAPEELMRAAPDYVLVLPWNLQDEIRRQLAGIRAWGGALRHPGTRGARSAMIFSESTLAGALIIDVTRAEDERGFFARSFCAEEFAARGLAGRDAAVQRLVQLRARAPCAACTFRRPRTARTSSCDARRASIFDVIVDLRPGFADAPALVRESS